MNSEKDDGSARGLFALLMTSKGSLPHGICGQTDVRDTSVSCACMGAHVALFRPVTSGVALEPSEQLRAIACRPADTVIQQRGAGEGVCRGYGKLEVREPKNSYFPAVFLVEPTRVKK